jgi:hypothetical protein
MSEVEQIIYRLESDQRWGHHRPEWRCVWKKAGAICIRTGSSNSLWSANAMTNARVPDRAHECLAGWDPTKKDSLNRQVRLCLIADPLSQVSILAAGRSSSS